VQETMVRAWRSFDRFEGRSQVSTWLHRIATNVCLTMLEGRQRRARPVELGPSSPLGEAALGPPQPEAFWLQPVPDGRVIPDGDPADQVAARELVRLAFVAALQHLPPRQRAALILCDVLRWPAVDVAELLDSSVASVNSALQRARATLAERALDEDDARAAAPGITDEQQALLASYVDAFERYDVSRLVTLLHDDAVMSMPPFPLWLVGPDQIAAWFLGTGIHCKGSRVVATTANGLPAFGTYRIDPNGGWAPWSIQVLEIKGDKIAGLNSFLDTNLFATFGLPAHLD